MVVSGMELAATGLCDLCNGSLEHNNAAAMSAMSLLRQMPLKLPSLLGSITQGSDAMEVSEQWTTNICKAMAKPQLQVKGRVVVKSRLELTLDLLPMPLPGRVKRPCLPTFKYVERGAQPGDRNTDQWRCQSPKT